MNVGLLLLLLSLRLYMSCSQIGRTLFCRHWHHVIGQLVQISSGQAGVWGVNRYNCAYYREGTYNDNGMNGERWTKVRIGKQP